MGESLDRRGVGHRCLEVEPGSSAFCCLLQLMHIISVSDFGLWKNTEERGVKDSRSEKTTGVYRAFFSVTLGTHEEYYRRQPVQIDEPRNKILRTSQCSLHAPIFESQEPRSRVPTDKGGDWGLYYQEC